MSAKEAVGQLLAQIAQTQLMNGMMGLLGAGGGGGLFGAIGGLLVPGFASGGSHKGGLRIVGEKGPELEATGAARIWNADQTRNMLAGKTGGAATSSGSQAGGQSVIMVELSPDLVARVLAEAEGQSVRISQQMGAAVNKTQNDRTNKMMGIRTRGGR